MAAKKDDFSVKHITPKLGGEREARNPNGPTSSYDLVEQMEFLYVKVNSVGNNPNATLTTDYIPIVEITLGNYKASTKNLPLGPWNQVFAFDKSKGDVLSVTLKEGKTNTVIGKENFKIAADIPTRVSPDSEHASKIYSMHNTETGYHMDLSISVWFGTQADEFNSQAWFSDAFEVSPSCMNNTRSKVYIAPRLCYVRLTIVSGLDVIATDRDRTPSVYVVAKLGPLAPLKTKVASGSNPSWNQDLIFVASHPLNDTVEFRLMDQIDDQHEECIGKFKKKLSEMTALKVPGSADPFDYPFEPPSKVGPVGDTMCRIKMKLATDQAYHVFDECIQYSSDYRAYAKELCPALLGTLEIGILGATGLKLPRDDDKKKGIDSYVVVKYGNKWARTRTVVDNSSPKWNEQYSFYVYDKSTVLTLGVYDNRNLVDQNRTDDVPIGKVRIPLSRLQWNTLYTSSVPILVLSRSGLKKLGEINIAVRCVRTAADPYAFYSAPFRWMLPKAHYKSPLSPEQIERLRAMAVQVNCTNLKKTEPPLRNEVVMDILKPRNQSFSMRKTKANNDRVFRLGLMLLGSYIWFNATVISPTNFFPKLTAVGVVFVVHFFTKFILWLVVWRVLPVYISFRYAWEILKYVNQEYLRWKFLNYGPPPLVLFDLKISKLDCVSFDELAEEFDSFPSSELDINVLKMRYDRLRIHSARVMSFLGDFASQGERLYALWKYNDPMISVCFPGGLWVLLFLIYYVPYSVRIFILLLFGYWVSFPCFRNNMPTSIQNFFRRLPTNEDLMI